MSFLVLIFKSAFRNRLRTALTAVGVAFAIIAFVFLRTVISAWNTGMESAAKDRLVISNKTSLTFSLPLSYTNKVKALTGTSDSSWANWFGGIYKNNNNFFAKIAVDAESYLRVYPEIVITPAEREAFMADRSGALVGSDLANKYHFKIGDRIPVEGDIYYGHWEFTVRGIYQSPGTFDKQQMFFHWKYLNEAMPDTRKDQIGWIVLRISDPSQVASAGRAAEDLFSNSSAPVRAQSEKAFQMSFLSMASTVIAAIQFVSVAVLLILALILGNTLAMATRERTTEYAMMRAVGFQPSHIVRLVIGEGFVISLLGAGVGLLLAPSVIGSFGDAMVKSGASFLPVLTIDRMAMGLAVLAALIGGTVSAGIPAYRASRMRIVDALRKVE